MPLFYPSHFLLDGTQSVTTTPAALNGGTSAGCMAVVVQNSNASGANLLVGNSGSQSMEIPAGQSETIEIDDVAKVWVKSASGSITVNWHARG